MLKKVQNLFLMIIGFSLVIIGLLFILLPGPAIIFLPVGLAILSLQFEWAKVYLKRCQRMMRTSAVALDNLWLRAKYWYKNRKPK